MCLVWVHFGFNNIMKNFMLFSLSRKDEMKKTMIWDSEDSTREKLRDNEGKLFKSKEINLTVLIGFNTNQLKTCSQLAC